MGRLDLLDVRRDEDAYATVCSVCRQWNRGTHFARGIGFPVCGRASCLLVARVRAALATTLVSNDPALD